MKKILEFFSRPAPVKIRPKPRMAKRPIRLPSRRACDDMETIFAKLARVPRIRKTRVM